MEDVSNFYYIDYNTVDGYIIIVSSSESMVLYFTVYYIDSVR